VQENFVEAPNEREKKIVEAPNEREKNSVVFSI
jgi:hypothetical protein